jgi:ComF family protein
MLLSDILDIFYPRKCISCRILLSIGGNRWLCPDCTSDFVSVIKNNEYCCKVCGRPIEYGEKCTFCNCEKIYYDRGMCLYEYEGSVRDAVIRFKMYDRPDYAEFFGDEMFKFFVENNMKKEYDYVTAVPMHISGIKKRGYNQSELLAKRFAKNAGLEYMNLLSKPKNIKPQHTLKRDERRKNVKNAFNSLCDLSGKSVLLIDDIITTGSTVNECCRILKKAGAKNVDFFTLCTRGL